MALYIKRDDRYALQPGSPLQGNKLRKLAPLLRRTKDLPQRRVVTFGGAYSDHLAALAAAARQYGFSLHAYVRGEPVTNPTLAYVRSGGARLTFVSRSDYRRRHDPEYQRELGVDATVDLLIPEGGTTPAALAPVGELVIELIDQLGYVPEVLCLSAGTGGTAAGVVRAARGRPLHVEVFPALRGDWMTDAIGKLLDPTVHPGPPPPNCSVITDYHFGGYAKFPKHWRMYRPQDSIALRVDIGEPDLPPLEPVYTAKLFTGVLDRIRKGAYARGTTVVILHTGGIY